MIPVSVRTALGGDTMASIAVSLNLATRLPLLLVLRD